MLITTTGTVKEPWGKDSSQFRGIPMVEYQSMRREKGIYYQKTQ